jgi:hypothetical protein
MVELTADERDLLERISDKEELQPFFFRKVKGLKWFDALAERGYFNAEKNPAPVPSKEEGYVNVPFWPATEYLVMASLELGSNEVYAERLITVVRTVTKYAIKHGFSNFRTWWQFSRVVQNIPPTLIQEEDIALFDYWLDDPYERNLVAEEIGEKWLIALLDGDDEAGKELATKLLSMIYRLEFRKPKSRFGTLKEVVLRFRSVSTKQIRGEVASKAGSVLGMKAIRMFQERLELILVELGNDKWSSMWRPAIEDHEQNHGTDKAEDIILEAYRDSLLAYIETFPERSSEYVKELLSNPFETVRRIAIYALDQRFQNLNTYVDHVITKEYFTGTFRHELWQLLRNHYKQLRPEQKHHVWEAIVGLVETDETGKVSEGVTAYRRAIWLSAIKDCEDSLAAAYKEHIEIIGGEPEHPDFSGYVSGGWIDHQSPFSKEELLSLDTTELVKQLNAYLVTYQPSRGLDEPDLEGLVKMLRQVVKAEPLRYYNHLHKFSESDLCFVYEVIAAYRELWSENAQLPWDEIWDSLLRFCRDLVTEERFWIAENMAKKSSFVANRDWLVREIGELIEGGTKSDKHAFDEQFIELAEEVILALLEKERGEEFKFDSDTVTVAMNSPRGSCIEALINLSLRSCRLADKGEGNHIAIWAHYQPIYDAELARAEVGEYEFAALLVSYLPNFLYLSEKWVLSNLHNIFDQRNYQKWLCAMNGYAYISTVHQKIYNHLKISGDFIRALDDENIKERVYAKIIQNIAVGYINNEDQLDNESSLIHQLLVRRKYQELSQLIWFFWVQRKDGDENIRAKVFELWSRLLAVIDINTREGKQLASKLCDWSIFIDEVNLGNKRLILAVAPFAEEEYNSHDLLESIAKISVKQPSEAYEIWLHLLKGTSNDFPESAIRVALTNLLQEGQNGVRMAKRIVSEYIRSGNERPRQWLQEIMESA